MILFYTKMFKIIKKIVASVTAFCGGAAAVFLISGTGEPLLRIMVFTIFFVSAINLGIYAKEAWAERKKKPAGGGPGKPGGGQGGGPGGGGGGQGGGGQGGGGPQGGGGGRPGGGPPGGGQR
ncbi:hypothetical protein C4J81_18305 [Deltaproteobacteria bacterium Smac51]|nr:hypothetical protein C4J81_18305 [Deltaproteobacteria bacterium Smac51]